MQTIFFKRDTKHWDLSALLQRSEVLSPNVTRNLQTP